jgi:lipopolysaccharide transport system ATP-binding protein
MSDIAIKVENISKLYQIGEVGTGTLSHDLNRWWAKIRGNEDPYIKVGQTNDRTKRADSDFVWALKDINFEIKQGEVLGIIGRNGAGKSTLLKILSKITSPTTGKIYTKGRIASLLEVGTGFHPEMTGRENVYLNGAILGMRKWEIEKKFDEIVDFAGVEAYIDTPVKRYSSGMYVRLAFAVSAFLEPEILIVDEVLAVGDAEFQRKCLGRMRDVSVNDGRTVLFVSHNIAAISNICNSGLLIQNGTNMYYGEIMTAISTYLGTTKDNSSKLFFKNDTNKSCGIKQVSVDNKGVLIEHSEVIKINIKFNEAISNIYIGIAVLNNDKIKLFTSVHYISHIQHEVNCEIPQNILLQGNFSLDVSTFKNSIVYDYIHDVCNFRVIDKINDYTIYNGKVGDLNIKCKWVY